MASQVVPSLRSGFTRGLPFVSSRRDDFRHSAASVPGFSAAADEGPFDEAQGRLAGTTAFGRLGPPAVGGDRGIHPSYNLGNQNNG